MSNVYGHEWAANYEKRANAAMPGREGLYRLCLAAFRGIASPARILVVGCGTGEELLLLLKAYPEATFVGIEPAQPMLDLCAQHVAASTMSHRVRLLSVSLDAFADVEPFDAATSILVSQHVEPDAAAGRFFAKIAALLKPDGCLSSADTHVAAGQDRDAMVTLWCEQAAMSGMDADVLDGMRNMLRSHLLRDEATIVGLLRAAGFERILKPFSSLIYGAWIAHKPGAP